MTATAHGTANALPSGKTPDLREIPLDRLAELAESGDDTILGVATTMIDGEEGMERVPATMFNSSI